MLKLSVVIITYNEEKNIARCLDSVLSIADEIVVVDSYSKDDTKNICKSYGVRFLENSFIGHIEQKNFAMHQASFDWILSLDADESIDMVLKESITQFKLNPTADLYQINRVNNYCGKWIYHSGWYPDRKIRLWSKAVGDWQGENPHDKFLPYSTKSIVGKLKGNILHYSYTSIEQHDRQIDFFSDISSKALFEKKIKHSFLMKFASAAYKFFYCYILRLGFLDGRVGWVIATKSALANYKKYSKLEKLWDAQ